MVDLETTENSTLGDEMKKQMEEQLDMFEGRTFGTSWKSQKLRWEEANALHRQTWEMRKPRRNRGYVVEEPRDPILRSPAFDVKALWVSREDQAAKRHTKSIIEEFDDRI